MRAASCATNCCPNMPSGRKRHRRGPRAGAPATGHRQRHLHDAGGRDRASPTRSCGRGRSRQYRPVVMGARLISITGMLQNEKGVIHVVARAFRGSVAAAAPLVRRGARIDPPRRPMRRKAGAGLMATSAASPVARDIARWRNRNRCPIPARQLPRAMAKEKPVSCSEPPSAHCQSLPKGRNFHCACGDKNMVSLFSIQLPPPPTLPNHPPRACIPTIRSRVCRYAANGGRLALRA